VLWDDNDTGRADEARYLVKRIGPGYADAGAFARIIQHPTESFIIPIGYYEMEYCAAMADELPRRQKCCQPFVTTRRTPEEHRGIGLSWITAPNVKGPMVSYMGNPVAAEHAL